MISNLSFSTTDLLWIVGFILFVIIGLSIWGRMYFSKKSGSNLTEKYKGKQWASPLEARNKYPDVNIFKHHSTLMNLSLILSLGLVIGLFNLTTVDKSVFIPDGATLLADAEIEIEPPRTSEPPAPPPPPPPPIIQEVPSNILIDAEDVEFVDQSVDAKSEIYEVPVAVEKPSEKKIAPPPPPPVADDTEEIFKVVEEMPRFPGCEDLATIDEKKACADRKLLEFIYKNIEYPPIARENNIEGTVVVRFVVDKDGRVKNPEIVRDIGGGCGEEAARVIKKMNELAEPWSPGKQRGRPVKVYYIMPVKFVLKVNN